MASHKTDNLQLHSWERTDAFSMDEFNENFSKIDKAVGENSAATSAALSAETQARKATDDTLIAAVAKCGNCKIVYGSYKGKGTYGPSNPNTLTFDGKPLLVIIMPKSRVGSRNLRMTLIQGCGDAFSDTDYNNTDNKVRWSENSVSWNFPADTNGSTGAQMNENNTTFLYIALIAMDEE